MPNDLSISELVAMVRQHRKRPWLRRVQDGTLDCYVRTAPHTDDAIDLVAELADSKSGHAAALRAVEAIAGERDVAIARAERAEAERDAARTAVQEALDWMDNPEGEPSSSDLVDRWRALLSQPAELAEIHAATNQPGEQT